MAIHMPASATFTSTFVSLRSVAAPTPTSLPYTCKSAAQCSLTPVSRQPLRRDSIMSRRPALSRDRVIKAAVRVADRGGLASVSMRNVGKRLGVEAMSLYHHVAGKDALLDGLADWVFTQIELPDQRSP